MTYRPDPQTGALVEDLSPAHRWRQAAARQGVKADPTTNIMELGAGILASRAREATGGKTPEWTRLAKTGLRWRCSSPTITARMPTEASKAQPAFTTQLRSRRVVEPPYETVSPTASQQHHAQGQFVVLRAFLRRRDSARSTNLVLSAPICLSAARSSLIERKCPAVQMSA